ncbi:sensor domain-containing diguanylate cyclase [Clostridium folliculivorans]|uniref:Diguanylate cyclase n=1 Tax=Clostridium folliculivorans TaxID=2886038 RepID=A0A9W5XZE9_9CLOT|nr:diguanylate cyclase [Clostridium folliculivorans]GKU23696.1 hypothetical protein CFOLD11_05220 [Clostridium folliculivorans]GKU29812.1 hypothetical protein CFB3_19190 [Clostridium folliculivorans]
MNSSHYNIAANFLREVYIEIDNNYITTFVSPNCFSLLGYTVQELLGKSISDILSKTPQNHKPFTNIKISAKTKTGPLIPIDLAGSPLLNENNEMIGFRFSLIDISQYVKFDESEKTLNKMFERSKDIIYRADLIPNFKFTYISPSIKEILGYTAEEHLINSNIPFEIVHPDDYHILTKKLTNTIDFTKPLAIRYKHRDGHYVWLDDYCIPIYDDNGTLIAIEGFSRNITDKKQLEEKLERLSYHDGLTGAYNKHYLEKEIHILNTETDTSIGIIFCDLDNLKITNDSYGHALGDKLIERTFNILNEIFTKNSVIARAGGDEFIIIIKNTSIDKVKELYIQLCESIEQQNKYSIDFQVKVSIGYSFSGTSIGVIRDFITIADKNMYKDKQRKKSSLDN